MKSLRLVPPLPPGKPGSEGAIDPTSIVPIVASEKAVTLGGVAALLLQVAHPKVAAGVDEHSAFQSDPLKRLTGTLEAVLVTTFGDANQAREMAQQVEHMHRPVHGMTGGERYSALSPELCRWIYRTLVEVALDAYDLFVRPLTAADREEYYLSSHPFAALFHATNLPASYASFHNYYCTSVDQLANQVDDRSRRIAQAIFEARLYGLPISPFAKLFAAGLLPKRLRQAYGLSWTARTRAAWWVTRRLVRLAVRVTPARLRQWSHYRVMQKRLAA